MKGVSEAASEPWVGQSTELLLQKVKLILLESSYTIKTKYCANFLVRTEIY